jgi:hypothetical protein
MPTLSIAGGSRPHPSLLAAQHGQGVDLVGGGASRRPRTDHPLRTSSASCHDLVHERFCVERMVTAIVSVYNEGAQKMVARRTGALAGT